MGEDTLHTWRREQLVAEVRTLRRDLDACTRDGQRLSRLLAEEEDTTEALEAALHALVDDDTALGWYDDEGSLRCPHCLERLYELKVEPQHKPDCPVAKARELLKETGSG